MAKGSLLFRTLTLAATAGRKETHVYVDHATDEQWNGNRAARHLKAPADENENTGNCVLVPAYQKDLGNLGRLANGILQHSKDIRDPLIFALLTDEEEVTTFAQKFPRENRLIKTLAASRLLADPPYNTSLAKLLQSRKCACKFCWETHRTISGIKRFLGVATLSDYGCKLVWSADAESLPLRNFSFSEIFQQYKAQPQLMATNMSHSNILSSPRHEEVTVCGARGLNLLRYKNLTSSRHVSRDQINQLRFLTTDRWVYDTSLVDALMKYFTQMHQAPFFEALINQAVGLETYYGLFVQFLAGQPDYLPKLVLFPDTLINSSGLNLKPRRSKLPVELARSIWACDEYWSAAQRAKIVQTLSWIRGWRFDHLSSSAQKKCANDTLRQSPTVTWATSNFNWQVGPVQARS